MIMPDYETLYPGRFTKKEMLDAPRLIRIMTVSISELENEKGQTEKKVTVKYRWAGGEGEIVWCKSNALLTAEALDTRDYKQWEGKYVVIYHEPKVSFGGKFVGGIRIMGAPTMTTHKELKIKMPRSKWREYYMLVPTDKKGAPLPGHPAPGMERARSEMSPRADASSDMPPPSDEVPSDSDAFGDEAAQ